MVMAEGGLRFGEETEGDIVAGRFAGFGGDAFGGFAQAEDVRAIGGQGLLGVQGIVDSGSFMVNG